MTSIETTSQPILIVGAGVAGLQMARALLKRGLQVVVLEQNEDVGGVWVRNYQGYGLQVPWELYQFPEFPYPQKAELQKYPAGDAVREYVRAYARNFDLYRHILFSCRLVSLHRRGRQAADGGGHTGPQPPAGVAPAAAAGAAVGGLTVNSAQAATGGTGTLGQQRSGGGSDSADVRGAARSGMAAADSGRPVSPQPSPHPSNDFNPAPSPFTTAVAGPGSASPGLASPGLAPGPGRVPSFLLSSTSRLRRMLWLSLGSGSRNASAVSARNIPIAIGASGEAAAAAEAANGNPEGGRQAPALASPPSGGGVGEGPGVSGAPAASVAAAQAGNGAGGAVGAVCRSDRDRAGGATPPPQRCLPAPSVPRSGPPLPPPPPPLQTLPSAAATAGSMQHSGAAARSAHPDSRSQAAGPDPAPSAAAGHQANGTRTGPRAAAAPTAAAAAPAGAAKAAAKGAAGSGSEALGCGLLAEEGGGWEAVYEDSSTGRQYTLRASFVVLCTGLYASPFVPTIAGQSLYRGLQVHSRDFTDACVAAGKRVLVVGAGKTAVDVVTELTATRTAAEVTLLYRRPHWPLPRFVGPVSIKLLAYTRLLTACLLPAYYDAGLGGRAAAAVLTPVRKAFWVRFMARVNAALGVKKTLGAPDRPICQDIWYSGQVIDAVRWPEVIHNPKVQAIQGEVDHFTPVSAVLRDGTELQPDIVLYATGYSAHYDFLEPPAREALDVQHDGLYLYRHTLPPRLPGLAFVGAEVSTFNNILTSALQSEWLAEALCGRVALPPRRAMAADVAAQRAWRRATMPPHKLRGSSVMLYMQCYHDQLLRDMGLPTRRKRATWSHPLAECLQPYTADDYSDLFTASGGAVAAAAAASGGAQQPVAAARMGTCNPAEVAAATAAADPLAAVDPTPSTALSTYPRTSSSAAAGLAATGATAAAASGANTRSSTSYGMSYGAHVGAFSSHSRARSGSAPWSVTPTPGPESFQGLSRERSLEAGLAPGVCGGNGACGAAGAAAPTAGAAAPIAAAADGGVSAGGGGGGSGSGGRWPLGRVMLPGTASYPGPAAASGAAAAVPFARAAYFTSSAHRRIDAPTGVAGAAATAAAAVAARTLSERRRADGADGGGAGGAAFGRGSGPAAAVLIAGAGAAGTNGHASVRGAGGSVPEAGRVAEVQEFGGTLDDDDGAADQCDEQDTLYSLDALPPALQAFRGRTRARSRAAAGAATGAAAAGAVERYGEEVREARLAGGSGGDGRALPSAGLAHSAPRLRLWAGTAPRAAMGFTAHDVNMRSGSGSPRVAEAAASAAAMGMQGRAPESPLCIGSSTRVDVSGGSGGGSGVGSALPPVHISSGLVMGRLASDSGGNVKTASPFAGGEGGSSGGSGGDGDDSRQRRRRRPPVRRGFSLATLLLRRRNGADVYDISSSRIEPSSSAVGELAYKVLPPRHVEEAMAAAAAAAAAAAGAKVGPGPPGGAAGAGSRYPTAPATPDAAVRHGTAAAAPPPAAAPSTAGTSLFSDEALLPPPPGGNVGRRPAAAASHGDGGGGDGAAARAFITSSGISFTPSCSTVAPPPELAWSPASGAAAAALYYGVPQTESYDAASDTSYTRQLRAAADALSAAAAGGGGGWRAAQRGAVAAAAAGGAGAAGYGGYGGCPLSASPSSAPSFSKRPSSSGVSYVPSCSTVAPPFVQEHWQ